jgi:hypothetical protein
MKQHTYILSQVVRYETTCTGIKLSVRKQSLASMWRNAGWDALL